MADDNTTRDRIRALVRDVLDKALPEESGPGPSGPPGPTTSRFIDVTPANPINTNTETTSMRDESSKTVITEDDVRGLENGAMLRVAESARLTPLAADLVREKGIELVRRVPRHGSQATRMVAVGADHGGFKMKEELKSILTDMGHLVHDFGTMSEDAVDYPDFAYAVAKSVADGTADVGIVIDGAGVGSAMTANKVPGVRAAAAFLSKSHAIRANTMAPTCLPWEAKQFPVKTCGISSVRGLVVS